jgi:hypothetical protein
MLLRVVCIQRTGETQSPICVEVPFDATVALLRKEIASFVGIPEQQQQIVWIRQMDDFVNGTNWRGYLIVWILQLTFLGRVFE